jgi:hypothetical protein
MAKLIKTPMCAINMQRLLRMAGQFSIEPFNGYALIKSSVASTEIVVSWAIMN